MIIQRKQTLHFPDDMLAAITAEAVRQKRTVSEVLQQAWKLSRDAIMSKTLAELTPKEALGAGRREQVLHWPEEMLRDIQMAAGRHNVSLPGIVQLAWLLAKGELAKLKP